MYECMCDECECVSETKPTSSCERTAKSHSFLPPPRSLRCPAGVFATGRISTSLGMQGAPPCPPLAREGPMATSRWVPIILFGEIDRVEERELPVVTVPPPTAIWFRLDVLLERFCFDFPELFPTASTFIFFFVSPFTLPPDPPPVTVPLLEGVDGGSWVSEGRWEWGLVGVRAVAGAEEDRVWRE